MCMTDASSVRQAATNNNDRSLRILKIFRILRIVRILKLAKFALCVERPSLILVPPRQSTHPPLCVQETAGLCCVSFRLGRLQDLSAPGCCHALRPRVCLCLLSRQEGERHRPSRRWCLFRVKGNFNDGVFWSWLHFFLIIIMLSEHFEVIGVKQQFHPCEGELSYW